MMLTETDIPAKEIKLAKILMDKPAPHCSAQSWAIYDQKSHTLMFGKNEKERREVASITKIMTCYVTLMLMDKFNKKDETLIEVSADASSVNGTSADLLEGDTLTI
jgi:D-alanyl-D-alanine carboxypeptidase